MSRQTAQSSGSTELVDLLEKQRPYLRRSFLFGMVASLLVLAPHRIHV
jgi:hypothetical protein